MSLHQTPQKEWVMTEQAFSKFLAWLNPDRDRAGEKYEEIRQRLLKVFVCRGCAFPEELADETINRVVRKIQDIGDTYVGEPALYFYGVAHRVLLESLGKKPVSPAPPATDHSRPSEEEYDCLEECLERLTPRSRDLVLEYYREDRHEKIGLRKNLAERLGIPMNALRIRACRIRSHLESCVTECLRQKRQGQDEMDSRLEHLNTERAPSKEEVQ